MNQPNKKITLSMPLKFEEKVNNQERLVIGNVTNQTPEALMARKAKYGDKERI